MVQLGAANIINVHASRSLISHNLTEMGRKKAHKAQNEKLMCAFSASL
jgi:hypothetical protein